MWSKEVGVQLILLYVPFFENKTVYIVFFSPASLMHGSARVPSGRQIRCVVCDLKRILKLELYTEPAPGVQSKDAVPVPVPQHCSF